MEFLEKVFDGIMSQLAGPDIPYTCSIPNGLQDGKTVVIKGHIPFLLDRFEINFLNGMDPSYADRPLHISVRMDEKVAVRNTLVQNKWQTEERGGRFPFQRGQNFFMGIQVKPHCYSISVNYQHCWDFVHRIPFYTVAAFSLKGSVTIERISFIDKSGSSTSATAESFLSNTSCPAYPEPVRQQPSVHLPPVYNPSIPYAYPIYGGIKPGMMIYISGKPIMSPYKFTINLQAGSSNYNPPDVAFHFDVRFYNMTIVRNSRTNNFWNHEETFTPSFPFLPNGRFDMIIRVTRTQFMVAVNGQHFIEFRHRLIPLARFDTLYIENDISVQSIRIG